MSTAFTQQRSAAAVPARAAAVETSADDMLVARIGEGDRLAMQTLFARHRTPVYRWLLRLVPHPRILAAERRTRDAPGHVRVGTAHQRLPARQHRIIRLCPPYGSNASVELGRDTRVADGKGWCAEGHHTWAVSCCVPLAIKSTKAQIPS
jgi:hypothetical protein